MLSRRAISFAYLGAVNLVPPIFADGWMRLQAPRVAAVKSERDAVRLEYPWEWANKYSR